MPVLYIRAIGAGLLLVEAVGSKLLSQGNVMGFDLAQRDQEGLSLEDF
jgi:hypothetical protein